MTLDETRQLGIEFERRIQTMIPETEFNRKMDTETIYSFLNQYLDKYISEIYRNLDNLESGTKLQAHIERILLSMLTSKEVKISTFIEEHLDTGQWNDGPINPVAGDGVDSVDLNDSQVIYEEYNQIPIIDTARSVIYTLPEDFYMYLRSVSRVRRTFSFKGGRLSTEKGIRVIPNQLMSQNDIWKVVETPHNSLRILRYPVAVLSQFNADKPTLTVIYDLYTEPTGLKILYYRNPKHFGLMTSTPCELPIEAFDDLVTGAVDLYIQYAAGAEARRRQLQEEQQRRNREDERDARRANNNNE